MKEEVVHERHGTFAKRGRFWAVTDAAGQLVCLAVYRKGAVEVLRRLAAASRHRNIKAAATVQNRRFADTTRRKKGKRR